MAKLVSRDQLLPPGVCTLCEQTPVDGASVADIGRSLVTGFLFHLQGVKYVCEGCAEDVAKAFGFEKGTRVEDAQTAQAAAEGKLNAIRDHVIALADNLKAGALDKVAETAPVIVAAESAAIEAAEASAEVVEEDDFAGSAGEVSFDPDLPQFPPVVEDAPVKSAKDKA